MIGQYDDLKQRVRLHEAVLKGKVKSTQNITSLGMRVILQKNKEMKHAKKQHISKVIKARKLKIKISQVLNIKNSFNNSFMAQPQGSLKQSLSKQVQDNERSSFKTTLTSKKRNSFTLKTLSTQKLNKNAFRNFSSMSMQQKDTQDDGRINIFDNFTQQQLGQIEEDQNYYLVKSDIKALFKKYMIRKRINNKDYSYDHFGIKPSHQNYLKLQQNVNLDKKSYILHTLGVYQIQNSQTNQLHLLTNPISFDRTDRTTFRTKSKSLLSLRQSKKSLFSLLKDKQQSNKDKLLMQQNKKILDLKIEMNYFDGLAAQKRAVYKEKCHDLVAKKNKDHDQKSIFCRQRIKTVRQNIGRSIELAETIRTQILKRRTLYKPKS